MSPNGWQRLWIVLAGMWAIPVALGIFALLPSEQPLLDDWAWATAERIYERDANLRSFLRGKTDGPADNDAARRLDRHFEINELISAYDDLSKREFIRRSQTRYSSAEKPSIGFTDINNRYTRAVENVRNERLYIIAGGTAFWAITCAAIYVLGLLVAWVVRGFRDNSATH